MLLAEPVAVAVKIDEGIAVLRAATALLTMADEWVRSALTPVGALSMPVCAAVEELFVRVTVLVQNVLGTAVEDETAFTLKVEATTAFLVAAVAVLEAAPEPEPLTVKSTQDS